MSKVADAFRRSSAQGAEELFEMANEAEILLSKERVASAFRSHRVLDNILPG